MPLSPRRWIRRLLAAGLVAASCAAPARADDADADADQARDHYAVGLHAFDLGKYDQAISEFQAAYRFKDAPGLLYNIAQAYRLSHRPKEALDFYQQYLARKPDAPNRSEVLGKIDRMQAVLEEHKDVARDSTTQSGAVGADPNAAVATGSSAAVTAEPNAAVTAEPNAAVTVGSSAAVTAEPNAAVAAGSSAAVTAEPNAAVASERSVAVAAEPSAPLGASPRADAPRLDTSGAAAAPAVSAPATTPLPAVARVATQHVAAPSDAVAARHPDNPFWTKRTAAWMAGGAGVVAAAVGVVFALKARGAATHLQNDAAAGRAFDPGIEAGGQSAQTLSRVLFATGLVGLATSGLLFSTSSADATAAAEAAADKESLR